MLRIPIVGLVGSCLAFVLCTIGTGQEKPEQELVKAFGRIELVSSALVAARDGGIVENVAVRAGQNVMKGDVLLRLDAAIYAAEVAISESQVKVADLENRNQVDLQFAVKSQEVSEKVLERSENANSSFEKSISLTDIDRLRLEMEKAELSAEQAEHTQRINQENLTLRKAELLVARLKLEERELTSPISGMVVQLLIQPGEFLQPGQAAIRVIALDRLRAVFRLPDAMVDSIKTGNKVTVTVDRAGKTNSIEGTIVFVSPETDSVQRDFLVWAEFENTIQSFRPGEPCQVSLDLNDK